mgnify:CR=1 FL=1
MNYDILREKIAGLYGKIARSQNLSNSPQDRENELRDFHEDVGFITGCVEGLILALEVSREKSTAIRMACDETFHY